MKSHELQQTKLIHETNPNKTNNYVIKVSQILSCRARQQKLQASTNE